MRRYILLQNSCNRVDFWTNYTVIKLNNLICLFSIFGINLSMPPQTFNPKILNDRINFIELLNFIITFPSTRSKYFGPKTFKKFD